VYWAETLFSNRDVSMKNTGLKLLIPFIITQTIALTLLVQLDVVNITLGPQMPINGVDDFKNELQKASLRSALTESFTRE
jgi:hypothetical protein